MATVSSGASESVGGVRPDASASILSSPPERWHPEHWRTTPALPQAEALELAQQTLRVNLRYQQEVIEAFNICPWAKAARTSNNAVPRVADGRPLQAQLADACSLEADVVFLIFPKYIGSRQDFEEWVAQVIAEDARLHRDESPPFAMAAFHPQASDQTYAELSPETLIPYLRRSPDPTIQLVRLAALARVRKGEPPGTSFIDPSTIDFAALLGKGSPQRPSLRQRVANTNHAVFASDAGVELRAAVDNVLEDRRAVHRRLGLPPSPWEAP